MSKHTLGPWHLAGDSDGTMVTADGGKQIAMWPPQGGTIEQCANARLIAASPELLDALQKMLVLYQGRKQGVFGEWTEPVIDARAAIAKATGGKP